MSESSQEKLEWEVRDRLARATDLRGPDLDLLVDDLVGLMFKYADVVANFSEHELRAVHDQHPSDHTNESTTQYEPAIVSFPELDWDEQGRQTVDYSTGKSVGYDDEGNAKTIEEE